MTETSLDDGRVSPEEPWVQQVRDLYERVDREIDPHQDLCKLRGVCCDFRRGDHVLYVTGVEVAYAAHERRRHAEAVSTSDGDGVLHPFPVAEDPCLCPFWIEGRCTARTIRPLGCRTYFCDPTWTEKGQEIHERYHRELQAIGDEAGLPYEYAPWVEQIRPPMPPRRA